MASLDQLQRVLRDFNFRYGAEVSGVISKTGVPIALQANTKVSEEHFATMSATLMGSSEVIYRELGSRPTTFIVARSEDGIIVVLNLERNTFFVAVAALSSPLARDTPTALAALGKVLDPLRPLQQLSQ